MQVEQAGPPNRPGRCLQENNRASQGRSRTRKRNRPSLPLEGSFLPRPTGKKPSRAFGRAPICRVTSGFPIEALTRSASTPTGASGAPRPAPRSPRGKPKAAAIGRGGVFRGDGEGKGPPAGNRRSAKSDFPAIRKASVAGGEMAEAMPSLPFRNPSEGANLRSVPIPFRSASRKFLLFTSPAPVLERNPQNPPVRNFVRIRASRGTASAPPPKASRRRG